MTDGDEKDLDGLQKQLGKLEADLNEAQQLAEALKDLENLSDALAKGEGECPSCGKKHGKDEKIYVFKFKRRKGYRRKTGHRQKHTEVRITDVVTG